MSTIARFAKKVHFPAFSRYCWSFLFLEIKPCRC
uniref:Uncharacterized protein n=1 Tax=Arundo donax TaxID=35708 RepID=A0A0A9DDN4_ARUDO